MQSYIDIALKYLPIVVSVAIALGLHQLAAALLRKASVYLKGEAGKTPAKWDDALADLLAIRLDRIAGLVESGDVKGATERLAQIKSVIPKAADKPKDS